MGCFRPLTILLPASEPAKSRRSALARAGACPGHQPAATKPLALVAIRIFDQKAERLTHGVFEASRGLPAERSQALRSEQDLGRVADPTTFAAGKFELG